MITLNATTARKNFFKLIENTNESGEIINIVSKNKSAYLISEEDWQSIEETLYLLSISGMRESIVEGLNTPVDDCIKTLDW